MAFNVDLEKIGDIGNGISKDTDTIMLVLKQINFLF